MGEIFWKDKKVFITGHSGFKGSWLVIWLRSLGAEVFGYSDDSATAPSLSVELNVNSKIGNVAGDIRDLESLRAALASFQPQIVFHLAAQSLVRYSYDDPIETYSTNVMGTVNLLECIRSTESVRSVVVVTSDKCYENKEWVWSYREGEPMGGHDPYSNSKACAELVTSAYRKSFFSTGNHAFIATARAGNVIGGGDWAVDRLVPDIVRAVIENRPVEIRNPNSIRPWQHVMEPLSGYMMLAQGLYEGQQAWAKGWNFGPSVDDVQTVGWIVNRICTLWGGNAKWSQDDSTHPHEAKYLSLDISMAKHEMSWKPKLKLDECLKYVVDWYKSRESHENIYELTMSQIEQYKNLN